MNIKENSRKEIEGKISAMGDYVKMGYLSECLKKNLDFDTKKFVLVNLAALYENKKMFREAGRCIRMAAEINTSTKTKIDEYVKSIELFAKGRHFDDLDFSLKKANSIASQNEKRDVMSKVVNFLKNEAQNAVKTDRRKSAIEIYEALLNFEISESDRKEINSELLPLYEKLGKIKEYYSLKKQF